MADLKELWKVVKLLLALSHGQATVERGFSNKEVMVENLAQHSLAAQRVICDHVRSEGGVLNVFSSKELLLSTASGRQTYHTALDEKRRENKGIRKEEILTWGNFHFERKEKIGDFVRSPTPVWEDTRYPIKPKKKLISLVCFILFITVSIIVITIIINVVIIFTSNKLVVFIYCMEFLANWMVGTCQQWYSIFINIPKHQVDKTPMGNAS